MSHSKKSFSVLVVEDDPGILIFIGRLLDRDGMRALLARTVEEAIGIAGRTYIPIDLILSNATLHGLSGEEAVERLREVRPGVPAVYMSAQTDEGVIRIDVMRGETRRESTDRGKTFLHAIQETLASRRVLTANHQ
jgi:DNA-binding response OmpR family regulator